MYWYQVALLGSPLDPLVYCSQFSLSIGTVCNVTLSNRPVLGVVLSQTDKPKFETLEIEAVRDTFYDADQIKTAQFMAEYYACSMGEALNLFSPYPHLPDEAWNASASLKNPESGITIDINLSEKQREALDFLREHPVALLFGDTGAGKSEIYMKRMDEVLRQGKRCLLLLPEISLTPQMEQRFKNHFGEAVVIWHSKMTPNQKKRSLQKIHDGTAGIVAGPRSALFLPIADLGMIVVDEEHDESYKSSSRPRYNARDMAIYIAALKKIPLILGSATPSLSSYAKYPSFRLRGGYVRATRRFVFERNAEALSAMIDKAVVENHARGKQGIVFLPTRANFKYLVCESCGYTVECPFCSVGMSLHRHSKALKCHYCNYTEVIPKKCPKCQSTQLSHNRLGTAEAVEHFNNLGEGLRIAQFDRDAITTQNKLIKVLDAFNKREIDLLVGTQMLSKGHDYRDIALSVIFGLDHLLAQADYRAREKALSLLIQIAGRSGRGGDATVIVQSLNEPFFRRYLEDYELFLQEEAALRSGRYPPTKKLARLLYAHKNGDKARSEMDAAVSRLQAIGEVEVVGWGASAIEKIAGKYRFAILLRSDKSTDLIRAIKAVKTPLCEVDMDPIEFT